MFCAGADLKVTLFLILLLKFSLFLLLFINILYFLKERLSLSNHETELLVENLRNTFDSLYRVPIPLIASIDGPALGGGLEMGIISSFSNENNIPIYLELQIQLLLFLLRNILRHPHRN